MRRALKRAYRRVQGDHPMKTDAEASLATRIACDLLLSAVGFSLIAGLGLVAFSIVRSSPLAILATGVVLVAASPLLLLIWERIAWEPFVERFSEL